LTNQLLPVLARAESSILQRPGIVVSERLALLRRPAGVTHEPLSSAQRLGPTSG
jgi:hypothetical protein